MTQFINKKIIVASLICAPFLLSGCGDDIVEEIPETGKEDIRWTRPEQKLVVNVPGEEGTRVVLVDQKETGGRGVKQTWETTDNVGVWNVTAAAGGQNGYNTIHPTTAAQTTNFAGTVNCSKGDKIAVFYPYGGGVTTTPDGTLTLDLRKQKGTLDDIAKNLNLVYGETTVSNVANGEASASLGTLTTGITILEFQFKDSDNNDAQLEFERVQIQIEGGHSRATLDLNNVGAGLTMYEPAGEVFDTIDVRPAALTTKVYVALFGESKGKTFHFCVIDKHGLQHKASSKAPSSLAAGQITRANLKAKDGDFIEIEDLKWARGNLLWDGGPFDHLATNWYLQESYLTKDCYFIAPSQEWSPEQLISTEYSHMPVWPVGAPVHTAVDDTIFTVPFPLTNQLHGYYGLFYTGIAGFNGGTSSRGYVVNQNSANPGTGSTLTVVQKTFSQDTPYQGLLWDDSSLNTPVFLSDALNHYNPVRYYLGDLPYLVSEGQYALPTVEDMRKIFEHPNRIWGVVFVPDNGFGAKFNMRVGVKHKNNNSLLPIYGLYVDKARSYQEMKTTHELYEGGEWGNQGALIPVNRKPAYKGCAVVLTEDDLKKGVFLPADGVRTATLATGGLEYVTERQPGEYCSYIVATFGQGAIGTRNARHYTARPDNHGSYSNGGDDGEPDVIVQLYNEMRTAAGSIRPVYIGDIYK